MRHNYTTHDKFDWLSKWEHFITQCNESYSHVLSELWMTIFSLNSDWENMKIIFEIKIHITSDHTQPEWNIRSYSNMNLSHLTQPLYHYIDIYWATALYMVQWFSYSGMKRKSTLPASQSAKSLTLFHSKREREHKTALYT